jgi:hypothetical protein
MHVYPIGLLARIIAHRKRPLTPHPGAAVKILITLVVLALSVSAVSVLAAPSAPALPGSGDAATPPDATFIHEEGTFDGSGELRLYEQRWKPRSTPRAALVLVHGLKDHSSRYAALAQQLAGQGGRRLRLRSPGSRPLRG